MELGLAFLLVLALTNSGKRAGRTQKALLGRGVSQAPGRLVGTPVGFWGTGGGGVATS